MDIKILGRGCVKCQITEEIVNQVVAETGAEAQVEKVTNMMEIVAYGVFVTPAVVIDGVVKLAGKVPTMDQVKSWLG